MKSQAFILLMVLLAAGSPAAGAQAPQSPIPPDPAGGPPAQAPALPSPVGSPPTQAATVSPVGTSGTTTAAPLVGSDYRLGSGDKIRVEVYREPQLSQSLQVRPDGKITLPFLGDMTAAGLTPIELRDRIGGALKDYVNNPVVTVMVVEALASAVYVMGQVNKPGTLALTGPTTALQALAMAGGLSEWAKGSRIKILRNGPGGQQTILFNYGKAVNGDTPAVYLQRGDTIIVP